MSIVRCAICNGEVDLDYNSEDMVYVNDEFVHVECLEEE